MAKTKIAWCDYVWNPIVGCSKVSTGCQNCYGERMAWRLKKMAIPQYGTVVDCFGWTGACALDETKLRLPLKWKKPKRIFVNSMGDFFHPNVKTKWIDRVLDVVSACPQHTFIILTKRPELIDEKLYTVTEDNHIRELGGGDYLPNLCLGVSVENQKTADERIPYLLNIVGFKRILSVEPMLEKVTPLLRLINDKQCDCDGTGYIPDSGAGHICPKFPACPNLPQRKLKWIICGPETGPHKRPFQFLWAHELYLQAKEANIPFFYKPSNELPQNFPT